MVETIVYKSNSGHSLRYAQMIKEETGLKCYDIDEALNILNKNAEIFFIGWICASQICGFKKARKNFNIKGLAGVGIYSKDDKDNINNLIKNNNIDIPFFYLQGGIDLTKLNFIHKTIIKIAPKLLKPEKEENIDITKNGIDYVKEENIKEIIKFIKDTKKQL
ncbi:MULTISPECIES: hypothetical protein [Anaerofustis]|uniref:hypothetical protein n=1 Tax=Anaerofustis TaxID=264995 RepID=UPI001105798C|nr:MULTISPECIES: hypothetical protein [Anaerofustis]MCO8193897.1 hypothetical protein [Anaerofustis sp. NSJ-163]